jgi:hypothetical protein
MGRTSWIAGLTLFVGFATSTNAAADPHERLMMKVLVQDGVGVAAEILTQARQEASRIFADAGVDLLWTTESTEELTRSRYVIVRIASKPLGKLRQSLRVMGLAEGTREGNGTLAYVFYDRVRDNGRGLNLPISLMMGHVIAHEMGHLLLSYGAHSVTGLMKGGWDETQTRLARRHELTFTPEQVSRIKSCLGAFVTR